MNIWQGYGMTESSSVLTLLGPNEHRAGGRYLAPPAPLPGVVLSIHDEDGDLLPVGDPARSAPVAATS